MKRRSARTAFSAAQLALWDELEAARPAPAVATPAPPDRAPRASPPAPGPALRDARGGPR